jgi:Leucine-rich repeat (LRR) protein
VKLPTLKCILIINLLFILFSGCILEQKGTIDGTEGFTIFTNIDDALKDPPKVYRLHLVNQNLTKIPAEIFSLFNLVELDLSKNSITVIPDSIRYLENLRLLRINKNNIETISPDIGELPELEVLELNRNHIVNFPATIKNMNTLRYLDIWGNDIGKLPEEIYQLKSTLKYLDIRNNPYPIANVKTLFEYLPETFIKYTEDCNCGN